MSGCNGLQSRTALVTGAGSGIGAQIARHLAGMGAAVAVNDLHEDRAETVAGEIETGGGRALAVPFDITDYEAAAEGVHRVEQALGSVDILVNNAGMPIVGFDWDVAFLDSRPEQWPPFVNLNLYGSLNCVHSVLPGMCRRG